MLPRLDSAMAGERELIFKHILTRDVAYESLPRRDRREAHEVAGWIERAFGERRLEVAELLAHHSIQAHRGVAGRRAPSTREVEDLRRRAFDALLGVTGEAHRRFAIAKATSAIEQALRIAAGPLERIAALEWMGSRPQRLPGRSPGGRSEAVDLRLAPRRPAAIARACASAVETLRWPGS